jgi:hypothetical protein
MLRLPVPAGDDLEGRCVRLKTGGVAFFVSDRLAATSLSCVPGTWRHQPEVTLLDRSREIPGRVVADSHAGGIALLETGTSTAGWISPVSLATGGPEDPAAGPVSCPGKAGLPERVRSATRRRPR